jgi:hypothetical protein
MRYNVSRGEGSGMACQPMIVISKKGTCGLCKRHCYCKGAKLLAVELPHIFCCGWHTMHASKWAAFHAVLCRSTPHVQLREFTIAHDLHGHCIHQCKGPVHI